MLPLKGPGFECGAHYPRETRPPGRRRPGVTGRACHGDVSPGKCHRTPTSNCHPGPLCGEAPSVPGHGARAKRLCFLPRVGSVVSDELLGLKGGPFPVLNTGDIPSNCQNVPEQNRVCVT